MPLDSFFDDKNRNLLDTEAQALFKGLIQPEQYVGEVFSLGYEQALVQIHDFDRQKVGGIPSLSFLIATRINTAEPLDFTKEDSSVILLRVMDAAPLPNEQEAQRIRVESAQRVSGDLSQQWETDGVMDPQTSNLLGYAGVKCRIIGTFFVDKNPDIEKEPGKPLVLRFGSDISNYYPNRGLKVFKPNANALKKIVNYRDVERAHEASHQLTVGHVRYASTNRAFQSVNDVRVNISPSDLLSQKTALFGMTRTGKSNTTKIILQSVFLLRFSNKEPKRVGQIVFDPNGEYANDNFIDVSSIKRVWRSHPRGKAEDVVTYGVTTHPNDPERRLMLLNFFQDENLEVGKGIIDAALRDDDVQFVKNFLQVSLSPPDIKERSTTTRHDRRVLVYRALLAEAGFTPPTSLKPVCTRLFGKDLLLVLEAHQDRKYQEIARVFKNANATWSQIAQALASLYAFITTKNSGYEAFNQAYMNDPKRSGESWADADLLALLAVFAQRNGPARIGRVKEQHTHKTDRDYVDDIYELLRQGSLVVVDQSSGDPVINKAAADRIMRRIFAGNQDDFRKAATPPEILVYLEEAHNLLPTEKEKDLLDTWVRTAKEGAKYRIGMVYATQEVSSIQRNILKNTANWFIGHLNNTDETRELTKYYDFADFEQSIRRAQDKGFIRIKTLSNLFVVPVQVNKFEIRDPEKMGAASGAV